MYRQSIIFFGIVIPLLLSAAVIGACAYVRGKITGSFDNKLQYYAGYERNRIGALAIETQLSRQRADFERWTELTSNETSSLVTTNIRGLVERLPPKEFQQTAFERMSQSKGFGSVTAQNSTSLKFSFRGTFRTMQRAFLELETMMPNLHLEELKIDPNTSGDFQLLNFQVTFSAWEK